MLPEWFWIPGLLIGAAIGSFLNVVIYRLPRGISLSNPPNSFCPKCEHRLGVPDLFPLFSWLISRGRCRYCHEPVASRYFFVELITGALWAGLTWQYLIVAWEPLRALFFALTMAALVAIVYIDWELFIIPDELNASILVIGILYRAFEGGWLQGLYGALVGWGILWGIALLGRVAFGKDAMGDGDVKMMRGVGFVVGPLLVGASIGLAVPLGLIGGITGIVIDNVQAKKRAASGQAEAADVEEPPPYATPIWVVLLSGLWYLLCLDVVGLFVPPLNRWVDGILPQENIDEEDDWKPSATTIPFGPYLAAGVAICLLFAHPIEGAIQSYIHGTLGQAARVTSSAPRGV